MDHTNSLITQGTAICANGHNWHTIPSTSHSHDEDQVRLTSGSKVDSQTVQCCPSVLWLTVYLGVHVCTPLEHIHTTHQSEYDHCFKWFTYEGTHSLSSGITSSLLWYTSVVSKGCTLKTESIMHTHTQTKHCATIIISMSLCTVRPTTLCSITTLQCH